MPDNKGFTLQMYAQEFIINPLRKSKELSCSFIISTDFLAIFFLVCSAADYGLSFPLSATVDPSQISEYFTTELKTSKYWMDMVFTFLCLFDTEDEALSN